MYAHLKKYDAECKCENNSKTILFVGTFKINKHMHMYCSMLEKTGF
jgi:hypothetical protein